MRDIVEDIFREALSSSFSTEFYRIFVFYISKGLNRDLFDAFLEDPAYIYRKVEEIYGFGTVFIFRAIHSCIRAKIELDISFNSFLDIVKNGDKEALRRIFTRLSEISGYNDPCVQSRWGVE